MARQCQFQFRVIYYVYFSFSFIFHIIQAKSDLWFIQCFMGLFNVYDCVYVCLCCVYIWIYGVGSNFILLVSNNQMANCNLLKWWVYFKISICIDSFSLSVIFGCVWLNLGQIVQMRIFYLECVFVFCFCLGSSAKYLLFVSYDELSTNYIMNFGFAYYQLLGIFGFYLLIFRSYLLVSYM